MYRNNLVFCGIDLAAKEEKVTGIAFLYSNLNVWSFSVFKDKEIVDFIQKYKPILISIDAPLSLPKSKTKKRDKNCLRKCDLELKKMKIRFFPINFGPMKSLTLRGINLKKILAGLGYKVIETFPGAFYDLNSLERKKFDQIFNFLRKRVKIKNKVRNLHELDAITCAYISYLYYNGKTKEIGNKREGTIIIPKV